MIKDILNVVQKFVPSEASLIYKDENIVIVLPDGRNQQILDGEILSQDFEKRELFVTGMTVALGTLQDILLEESDKFVSEESKNFITSLRNSVPMVKWKGETLTGYFAKSDSG